MPDVHKNFAESLVAIAPSPAISGTSLTVTSTEGGLFPATPFNATVWPAGAQPTTANAEIVRVTNILGDVFTIVRAQEGTPANALAVGFQIAATITAKTMFDAENPIVTWSPFIVGAGAASGLQTISSTSQSSGGSMLVFPITVPQNIQFNQIILPVSLSQISGTAAGASVQAIHMSKFGLYSLNNSLTFSLISSSFFSIAETVQSSSLTWNYPVTTYASGYGYGSFDAGFLSGTPQMASYISNTRGIGLVFGGNIYLGEGRYWLGVLGYKTSTAGTLTFGLSNAGLMGQIMNPVNIGGNSSGPLPFGLAGSLWSGTNNSHFTQWRGRHIAGFVTATSLANFGGTAIPTSFDLSNLSATAAAALVSVLPTVTFVST
jgi:hypothetical protein